MDGTLIRLGLLVFVCSYSIITRADKVNNEWLSTTRAETMGNVGIANSDDPTTASFYNPAALARAKKLSFEFFNPQFEVGTADFNMGGATGIGKQGSLKSVEPLLAKKSNKTSSLGFSVFPNFYAQNFDFGVLMRADGASYMDSAGKLYYRSKYFVIPSLAMSIGLLGGKLRFGYAVRAIQATENDRSTTSFSNIGYMVNAQSGFGVGLDSGALLTLPMSGLPTFGFVARNVGDTAFSGSTPLKVTSGTTTTHDKIKSTYDAGFSLFPKIAQNSILTLAADYRDIRNVNKVTVMRRVNLGMELSIKKIMFVRAGYSRGYWSAGLGLASSVGSVDLGTYGDEMDPTGYKKVLDRRITLRIGKKF